jgi:hypothetical protein
MREIYNLGYATQKPWVSECTPAIDFNVRKFSKHGSKNIDHIILHTFKTHKESVDGLDFLFCKVYFDGKKLYINNVESVVDQYTIIDEEAIRNSLKMASYDIRPEHLNSTPIPYSDKVDHVFEKFIDRKIKYQKRGFVVKTMSDTLTQISNIAKEMDI